MDCTLKKVGQLSFSSFTVTYTVIYNIYTYSNDNKFCFLLGGGRNWAFWGEASTPQIPEIEPCSSALNSDDKRSHIRENDRHCLTRSDRFLDNKTASSHLSDPTKFFPDLFPRTNPRSHDTILRNAGRLPFASKPLYNPPPPPPPPTRTETLVERSRPVMISFI